MVMVMRSAIDGLRHFAWLARGESQRAERAALAAATYALGDSCAIDGDEREGLTFWAQIEVLSDADLAIEVECQVCPDEERVVTIRVLTLMRGRKRHRTPASCQDVPDGHLLYDWLHLTAEGRELVERTLEACRASH